MNIYEIKTGETEWVCANTALEALGFYLSLTDIRIDEFSGDDDITLVPREDWDKLTVTMPDDYDEITNKPKLITFTEAMEGRDKPDIIASTAY